MICHPAIFSERQLGVIRTLVLTPAILDLERFEKGRKGWASLRDNAELI